MTTIAWDGHTLAADRCATFANSRFASRKLKKLTIHKDLEFGGEQVLVAGTGYMNMIQAHIAWLENGGTKPDYKDYTTNEVSSVSCIVVFKNGIIRTLSNGGNWSTFYDNLFAAGAGAEMALGAMMAGATAERAVEITSIRSDYSSMGIDTASFDE